MRSRPSILASSLAALLLVAAFPAPAQASTAAPAVLLGMDTNSIAELKNLGAPPSLASFWIGPWTATSGWGALDHALTRARDAGATPVVYWYYWGDSITPSCVEHGCDGRSRAQWDAMTNTLAERIRTIMGGRAAIVVLENEFNKGGIDSSTYAPTFDNHLSAKATQLKGVPGVKVAIGYGSWGESNWHRFPKTLAASDFVGFQMMRGQTRDSESTYRGAPDKIASVLEFTKTLAPGKGALLYDLALSSYPDAHWARVQNETMSEILARLGEYASNGLGGIVYRELRDNPGMSPANYFGYAEQHWGLRAGTTPKPVWHAWAAAHATTAPAIELPASFEAESMQATTGVREAQSGASGGAVWNLWRNGELSQKVDSAGATYRVTIDARGSPAQGVYPHMELRVDGARVASWTVPGALASYAADAYIPAGARTIAVAFTNDAYVSPEDRNLYVDHVRVEAANRAPSAGFAVAGAHLSWSFDASASSDPDGDALSYAWSFGDGATAGGRTASRTYAAAGTYTVTLTVSDGKASDTATRTVTATRANAAPTASFASAGSSLSWSFDASASSDADGDPLSYAWSFGDGGSATGRTATRTYAAAGTYTVTLTVSDGKASATTTRAIAASAPFAASFSPYDGNEWWIQTRVSANAPLAGVCASINGGACQPLTYRDWDAWAASYHAPGGSQVRFTATSTDGQSVTSASYAWGTPPPPPPPPPFTATFSPYGGNTWWIQTKVDASERVRTVCASVNGGACQPLSLRDWGAWAESYKANPGSKVVFKATGESGRTVTSPTYTWPAK